MKFKAQLFFTAAFAIFASACVVLVLFNYNPFKADISVFAIFYGTLFVALTGFLTFLILFIKSRTMSRPISAAFWPTVRQSVLISAVLIVLLFLQGLKILDLWVGIPLALAILLLELFFRRGQARKT